MERTHAARNAVLNHENKLLKTEIKRLEDQVSDLQSTASAVLATSSGEAVHKEQREASPREELPRKLEETRLVAGLPAASLSNPYLSPNFELWSQYAMIYPPLIPFKQPQAVADALLGPSSKILDSRAV